MCPIGNEFSGGGVHFFEVRHLRPSFYLLSVLRVRCDSVLAGTSSLAPLRLPPNPHVLSSSYDYNPRTARGPSPNITTLPPKSLASTSTQTDLLPNPLNPASAAQVTSSQRQVLRLTQENDRLVVEAEDLRRNCEGLYRSFGEMVGRYKSVKETLLPKVNAMESEIGSLKEELLETARNQCAERDSARLDLENSNQADSVSIAKLKDEKKGLSVDVVNMDMEIKDPRRELRDLNVKNDADRAEDRFEGRIQIPALDNVKKSDYSQYRMKGKEDLLGGKCEISTKLEKLSTYTQPELVTGKCKERVSQENGTASQKEKEKVEPEVVRPPWPKPESDTGRYELDQLTNRWIYVQGAPNPPNIDAPSPSISPRDRTKEDKNWMHFMDRIFNHKNKPRGPKRNVVNNVGSKSLGRPGRPGAAIPPMGIYGVVVEDKTIIHKRSVNYVDPVHELKRRKITEIEFFGIADPPAEKLLYSKQKPFKSLPPSLGRRITDDG
ncbi:hypothetical protein HK098_001679 [Nowakowskiella sp. JEL0407]|nr:hypothetical protein HK098_001679 [Nowakowskiella sp. JEL0407]